MKLHTWLVQNGKTAAWLAEKTKLSPSYVSRLIDDSRSPSIETCAKIEQATGGEVTANDFMPQPKRRPSQRAVARAA